MISAIKISNETRNYLFGILWILANNLTMALQSTINKKLSKSLPPHEIVFLYKMTVFIFVLIWVIHRGIHRVKTKKPHLHFFRACLSLSAAFIFVSALKNLPLATAMAVGNTEPIFATLLAVIFFKEFVNIHVIGAVVTGFIGFLIVVTPGIFVNVWNYMLGINTIQIEFNVYELWVLAAAIIWGIDCIVIKMLGQTENSLQYLFYISLFSTILGINFVYGEKWVNVEIWQFKWIFLLAVMYFIHLIAVFKAYKLANLSLLAPFDFSRIIFSSILGVLIFKDSIKYNVIIGGLVIVSSSAYIVWKKEKNKQNESAEKLESTV